MRTIRRGLGMLSLTVFLLICLSGAAVAHVTVQPSAAAVGSETTFVFRVPTEKQRESTVKVVLVLPITKPIPVVSLKPVPGWTADVTTATLARPVQTDDGPVGTAISRITWTAGSKVGEIAPGQFQEFTIEAGPLPKAKLLVFNVLQYYSDGSVVRWIDPPTSGGELEHPAPTVTLGAGPTPSAVAGGTSDSLGNGWIAVSAFVAGLLGLAAGTAALVVARRSGNSRSS